MANTCDTCSHWRPVTDGARVLRSVSKDVEVMGTPPPVWAGANAGLCTRNAPTAGPRLTLARAMYGPAVGAEPLWPRTFPSDACGEWRRLHWASNEERIAAKSVGE